MTSSLSDLWFLFWAVVSTITTFTTVHATVCNFQRRWWRLAWIGVGLSLLLIVTMWMNLSNWFRHYYMAF